MGYPAIWTKYRRCVPSFPIEHKTGPEYDRAAAPLGEPRELAGSQGRLPELQARLAELQARYPKSRALQDRLNKLH